MRVNNIALSASCGIYKIKRDIKSLPLNLNLQKTEKSAKETIPAAYHPSFTGIIYFKPAAKFTLSAGPMETAGLDEDPVKESEPVPEEIISLYERAGEIQRASSVVLDNFEDVLKYAKNTTNKVNGDYSSIKAAFMQSSPAGVLEETNNSDEIIKKASYDDKGRLKMIKDYEENRIIFFDYENREEKSPKFTVYLNCVDIDNPDFITAKEAYTFESGMLSRYFKKCKAEINTDWFTAESVYSFKRNVLKSYDKSLTVSLGTEYSNEYFEYKLHPSFDYTLAPTKAAPVRYVKGKVEAKGIIRYSSDEILFRYYGL